MSADDHPLRGALPLFLNREQAATYVGVSVDTFAAEVAAELWPPPVRRGESGRRLTWYRPALDAAAAQLAASARAAGPAPSPATVDDKPAPPAFGVTPEEVEALKEKINAARQNRPQRRHEKAA